MPNRIRFADGGIAYQCPYCGGFGPEDIVAAHEQVCRAFRPVRAQAPQEEAVDVDFSE